MGVEDIRTAELLQVVGHVGMRERGLGLGGRRPADYRDYGDHQGGGAMVQVYDLGLDYGFVSNRLRGAGGGYTGGQLPRPGVTLNTRGALFRYRKWVS